ncbi:hypothetical protein LB554_15245 [Mesorhizobium sp. CO1-1-11]|uniref:hypothetical protein n=1 Tax=Mesorhizobium sp. CO1-1-11 TaxID=2876636 RepID=UPI001CCB14AB|nr:hypothetical protein [Mesorhizobium sp. CO1-1-11]MBZ9725306.1 hypothetical protein [Mesorhizobium sp. CO1-1-11]
MTAPTSTIRPITYSFELLDWMLEKAMQAGPMVPVAATIIELLNEMVTEIHAYGFLPAQAEPGVYLDEVLNVLSQPSNVGKASEKLIEFVHDILIARTILDQEQELYQVIEQLAKVARLESAITFKNLENGIRITSSDAFIAAHGVLIDVTVLKQLRVRSALRPWHPRYGWEVVAKASIPKKASSKKTRRGGSLLKP